MTTTTASERSVMTNTSATLPETVIVDAINNVVLIAEMVGF